MYVWQLFKLQFLLYAEILYFWNILYIMINMELTIKIEDKKMYDSFYSFLNP